MLEFDYTNVLDSSAGPHGIPQGAFEKAAKSSHLMVDALESARTGGKLGFADFPFDEKPAKAVTTFARNHAFPNEYMTAYAGELYDINAFDQPGVEYGKKLTFAMMGRPGFEKFNATIEASQRRERAIVR